MLHFLGGVAGVAVGNKVAGVLKGLEEEFFVAGKPFSDIFNIPLGMKLTGDCGAEFKVDFTVH